MKELSQFEVQQELLYLLKEFDSFCKKHNFSYSLAGGTLLGAVRHKGFIPWVNDIDVCMPRKDYDNFLKSFESNNPDIRLLPAQLTQLPFSKLVNLTLPVYSKYNLSESEKYLWIDIFPVEEISDNDFLVNSALLSAKFLRKICLIKNARIGQGTTKTKRFVKPIIKFLSKLIPNSLIDYGFQKILCLATDREGKRCCNVVWGLYGKGEIMMKKDFLELKKIRFEGQDYPVFSCWDIYLSGLYGNYMELPPKEERFSHMIKVQRL